LNSKYNCTTATLYERRKRICWCKHDTFMTPKLRYPMSYTFVKFIYGNLGQIQNCTKTGREFIFRSIFTPTAPLVTRTLRYTLNICMVLWTTCPRVVQPQKLNIGTRRQPYHSSIHTILYVYISFLYVGLTILFRIHTIILCINIPFCERTYHFIFIHTTIFVCVYM
jgi:hypothetical protein